ncbi:hypothetical protein KFK09_009222 [Dendrobium nobile]|uniref:Uncharacterized protein n=1 Tax=Dendrobium nobile TaxID=94219 RepID=A0A8T3BQD2_DENNO|nr:hypothetical protein KFK09_009222 [Dendrobium nobile]
MDKQPLILPLPAETSPTQLLYSTPSSDTTGPPALAAGQTDPTLAGKPDCCSSSTSPIDDGSSLSRQQLVTPASPPLASDHVSRTPSNLGLPDLYLPLPIQTQQLFLRAKRSEQTRQPPVQAPTQGSKYHDLVRTLPLGLHVDQCRFDLRHEGDPI